MKFNLMALTFVASMSISAAASACQTVMGGCAKDATHDTSSHMKSQIVNKVEAAKLTQTSSTGNKTKLNQKSGSASGNLAQTINKTVLK